MLGLAEIESMASGTPVICSRLGGLAEMVRHGETGFLVEPGNVAELRTGSGRFWPTGGRPGAWATVRVPSRRRRRSGGLRGISRSSVAVLRTALSSR